MSGDEPNQPDDALHELSDEQLDEVAGGLNFRLNAAFFSESNVALSQKTQFGSGCGSTETAFQSQNIQSAGLQIVITDATAEDLQILGDILGDASAIEGSA